jgi:hypothetical protein
MRPNDAQQHNSLYSTAQPSRLSTRRQTRPGVRPTRFRVCCAIQFGNSVPARPRVAAAVTPVAFGLLGAIPNSWFSASLDSLLPVARGAAWAASLARALGDNNADCGLGASAVGRLGRTSVLTWTCVRLAVLGCAVAGGSSTVRRIADWGCASCLTLRASITIKSGRALGGSALAVAGLIISLLSPSPSDSLCRSESWSTCWSLSPTLSGCCTGVTGSCLADCALATQSYL